MSAPRPLALCGALLLSAVAARAAAPAPATPPAAGPPSAAAKPRGPRVEALPRDDDTLAAALDDFLAAHARWADEAAEFRKDVRLLIERKVEERRARLTEGYDAQLKDLEADERALRQGAIERFEAFVARYPDEPRATPDAMFRLAELYFEASKDEQRLAQKALEERIKRLPAGEELPPEPPVAFEKSIALYRRILSKFPTFRLADGVLYLLGYVLDQQGDSDESLASFESLIARFPSSRFVAEAWMRVGEHWFDFPGTDVNQGLLKAAAAYGNVARFPDHPLYDKGLYKLGWTWYRLDDYAKAVEAFASLIDTYDQRNQEDAAAQALPGAGAKGSYVAEAKKVVKSGGELRDEALQYTAISFSDEQWGGVEQAKSWFAKRGGRPWEPELWRKLGDVFFERSKHDAAVESYRIVLAKNPEAPFAPQIQQRIVQAYERERDFEKAWKERDALVKQFGEGSLWYEANKKDPEVLAQTRELMERSLYSSAVFHHQQAQTWKKSQRYDLALKEFQAAALAYGVWLERFPHSKKIYETRFYYAESLYNSLQFERAAEEYTRVRDDQTDGRYQGEAAYAVVLALQKEIDRLERVGKMDTLPLLKAAERPEGKKIEPIEVEEAWRRQIAAADAFVKVLPKDEKAPELLYKTGETFYRHNQFEEARKRFGVLLEQYPQSAVAEFAGNLTIETYLAEQDWAKVEESSAAQLARGGKKLEARRRGELSGIRLGARFKRATQLMDGKQYEPAAQLFLAAVDEDPKAEFADKALNNAAFCFQQALRYESALKTYERLFTQYPKSPLADTALFLVGYSAEKAFDFDKAIERYETLVRNYPTSPKRADAAYNVAHALERLQRYDEAQHAFVRYAQLFPDKEDAPSMQFEAAGVAEKRKDWKQAIADLTDYIRRFQRNDKEKERIVQAYLKIGLAFQKLGSEAAARQAFQDAVAEYDKRRLTPAELVASAAAAEAKFNLAELEFAGYDKIKIEARGRGAAFDKSLKGSLTRKAEEREKILALYRDVAVKYKRPDWIVAALYRVGHVDERFSAALTEAPVPPELKRLGDEYVAQYQDTLAQASVPIDERAIAAYKKAIETARELKIANEWTRRILESLDRYDHKSFPLLKDPKQEFLLEPLAPTALALADGSPIEKPVLAPAAAPAGAPPAGLGARSTEAPAAATPAAPADVPKPAPQAPSGKLGGSAEDDK